MSKISVLISLFNGENYIEETLKSVLNQTYQNLEVIIVDDGSSDNSYKIVKKYEAENVQIFQQKNAGQSAASNLAIKKSTGDYIKFMDADDIISPNHLELQFERLKAEKGFVASCEWGRFYDKNHLSAKFNPEPVWKDLDSLEWIKSALFQKTDMMGAWLWLIPRTILDKAGIWDERLSLNNDFDFSVRLLLASKGVKFTKGAKLYYRSGVQNSLSQSFSLKAVESAFLTTKLGCNNILSRENSDSTRRLCANRYQTWIHRIYPQYPQIVKKFKTEVAALGGSKVKIEGGRLFALLRGLLGWKMTKRIQLVFYKLGWNIIAKIKQKIKMKKSL